MGLIETFGSGSSFNFYIIVILCLSIVCTSARPGWGNPLLLLFLRFLSFCRECFQGVFFPLAPWGKLWLVILGCINKIDLTCLCYKMNTKKHLPAIMSLNFPLLPCLWCPCPWRSWSRWWWFLCFLGFSWIIIWQHHIRIIIIKKIMYRCFLFCRILLILTV